MVALSEIVVRNRSPGFLHLLLLGPLEQTMDTAGHSKIYLSVCTSIKLY